MIAYISREGEYADQWQVTTHLASWQMPATKHTVRNMDELISMLHKAAEWDVNELAKVGLTQVPPAHMYRGKGGDGHLTFFKRPTPIRSPVKWSRLLKLAKQFSKGIVFDKWVVSGMPEGALPDGNVKHNRISTTGIIISRTGIRHLYLITHDLARARRMTSGTKGAFTRSLKEGAIPLRPTIRIRNSLVRLLSEQCKSIDQLFRYSIYSYGRASWVYADLAAGLDLSRRLQLQDVVCAMPGFASYVLTYRTHAFIMKHKGVNKHQRDYNRLNKGSARALGTELLEYAAHLEKKHDKGRAKVRRRAKSIDLTHSGESPDGGTVGGQLAGTAAPNSQGSGLVQADTGGAESVATGNVASSRAP